MSTAAVIGLAIIVLSLVYWFPVRAWYRRADARRLADTRAMWGDTDILVPDYESTLAISVEAPPSAVWDALLHFGWPRSGRAFYEWLGRASGFLAPAAQANDSLTAPALAIGRGSQIAVRTVDPVRALVVGGVARDREWRWQFEISRLDERRTRIILRDAERAISPLGRWLHLAIPRLLSFVLTRKMLLDIKTAAESRSAKLA